MKRVNIDNGASGLFTEGTFDGALPYVNKHWLFTTLEDIIQEGSFVVEAKVVATYRRVRLFADSNWGEWKLVKRI